MFGHFGVAAGGVDMPFGNVVVKNLKNAAIMQALNQGSLVNVTEKVDFFPKKSTLYQKLTHVARAYIPRHLLSDIHHKGFSSKVSNCNAILIYMFV